MIREAVSVFDNIDNLNRAVEELETTAFPRQDISVLAGEGEVEKKLGMSHFRTTALEDNPDAPRTVLIRPEEKVIGASFFTGGGVYIGAIVAALLARSAELGPLILAIALGGAIGGLIGGGAIWLLERRYNNTLKRQIEKGGILLWVRTPEPQREQIARDILTKYGAKDVHIHQIN